MEQSRRFCPNAIISTEKLDLFKSALGVTQEGGSGTSAPDASTLFSFLYIILFPAMLPRIFLPRV